MICRTLSVALFFVSLAIGTGGAGIVPSDAVILESGSSQTREEYAREHLAEDIVFAKAVPGTRSRLSVKHEGDVAWTTATTQFAGTFDGHEISSRGVELMVLTKMKLGWRIRAIHWSSHKVTKPE